MPVSSIHPKLDSFRPIGLNLLVRRHSQPEKIGTLYFPEAMTKTGLDKGTVLAVAAKVTKDYPIAPGDTVVFPCQLGYAKVILNGKPAEIIPLHSITAVIPK